ncbi:MAG: DNA-deoxyinosine glycosylase [Candidatus Zeuxoniibacter abyssi]|nr:MAG: DNA-deoxyinosine glycosylase [Candidatus Persebacteraceae bacterium AB1(2)]
MKRITGLPPVLPKRLRLLILGSMPGVASLAAQQYYAHPQNAFWPIFLKLANADNDITDYDARIAALKKTGVGLWDVLASCHRRGSLNSAIQNEKANDIAALLLRHKSINVIALNGGKAFNSFRLYVKVPQARLENLQIFALTSTSPANAGKTRAQKLADWQVIAKFLNKNWELYT